MHADQVGAHLRRCLIAVFRIFGQRLENDGVQVGGEAFVPRRRWDRVFAHMLVGNRDG
ncbi:Uncharacterised protein [Mycobacterium tuberculosis]|uniref:Uncharacterized protein n=1 Tax=Mycobacterium tuberculosis TaxID=1773 RepID=A0A916LBA0_MYCTX|nr:Uncharacterised protein [Mycobacterium tuberculosis]COW51389.1 Uncharacterised protein [Mycobacterium tuberculosis]COX95916.1 Uncharacterised protein [Mycobacterium tuberculosis]